MSGPAVRGLEGIRVLDLADQSAAFAGRILADLGAEVILVEPPVGGPTRHLRPFLDRVSGPERSCVHQYFGANKRSVIVDIEDVAGRETFLSLVATADVVLETARPGHWDALGLGPDVLASARPDLIQISVTPFGIDTEWADRLGNDLIAGAAGGLVGISGEPRGTPVQGGANPSYCMASLTAASAATIAITHRDANGEGAHISVSLQEATVTAVTQTNSPSNWTWFNRIPRRPGLSSALECADGGFVGHLVRPDGFAGFLKWLDDVGIEHDMTIQDAHWAVVGSPRKGNPVMKATFDLAAALTRDEFAAGALEADIVCLPVLGFDDMLGYEQYRVNEQFSTIDQPSVGKEIGFVRSPMDVGQEHTAIRPAPTLGQHSDTILGSLARPTPAEPRRSTSPGAALDGIRVVDFGWVLAAPLGGRIFASFGAEVIRVESSTKLDSMRRQVGPDGMPDPNLGGLFNSVNAGKKSLTVDLRRAEGLELVLDLVGTADVVVNNFRPGALERMGLGYDRLRQFNDEIILLNMPGAHPIGPWAVRPSMGNILMAASGFNMLTGFPDEKPRGIGVAYPDFTGPHFMVAAVLSALRRRRKGHGGQELTVTQLSGVISMLGVEWMQFADRGEQPARRANRDPNHCPQGVYAAAGEDQWVAIAVGSDEQWQELCSIIGAGHLAQHSFAERRVIEDDIDRLIEEWTFGVDKWRIGDVLQARGIAAAPVEDLSDTYDRDPQLGDHYQIVHQPSAPDVDIPIDAEPARWIGADHRLTRSPELGEHNHEIVVDLLGRSQAHYEALVESGVLS